MYMEGACEKLNNQDHYRVMLSLCYKRKTRENTGRRVVVACSAEEYHEIGARMAADFFTLSGYSTTFVGSNTSKEDFLAAISLIKPYYIVVSVTNYYNLIAAKKAVGKIKEEGNFKGKILVAGYAFKNNKEAVKNVGADKFIDSFQDIRDFSGEEV